MTGYGGNRAWVTAIATLAAIAVAGCSGPSSTAPSPFPPRPAELRTADIDPCSVITDTDRRRLGVERGTAGESDVGIGAPSRTCGWRNFDDGYGYNVQTIPTAAGAALSVPGSTVRTVNGFGAVENVPADYQGPGIPPACQLTIDVGEEQAVRVQVQSSDTRASGSPEALAEACSRANALAHSVMRNLVAAQS
ncbi:DUF3558 domain-containing protein [Pseudonocardia sp. KRD291]|uniref:DUF3558 domain-containing protein n=1 Tax=Pseudonocardia sp. KRD291 TaxID=2792007 RepID=UPI001C4A4A1E|nr:DUF3558 domain-containing protein [Pseudonocardia sp. KRD291]MBW0106347.1 DUF3558 domain-containing protein [Pseudonocardia sp. KRD291]